MGKIFDDEDIFIFKELIKENNLPKTLYEILKKVNVELKERLRINHKYDYYAKRIVELTKQGWLKEVSLRPKSIKINDNVFQELKEITNNFFIAKNKILSDRTTSSIKNEKNWEKRK